jgi:HSP20 family molecular chaperone IbpA
MYGDFNDIFDGISSAAKKFQQELSKYAQERYGGCYSQDYRNSEYNDYDWPPVNIYKADKNSADDEGGLIFEFGLAGFEEEDINLTFQGDYMILSAVCRNSLKNCCENGACEYGEGEPEMQYLKKTLRLDTIEKQKYYVAADKYDHKKTKAVYKNGLLRISIPPKEEYEQNCGLKIKISS